MIPKANISSWLRKLHLSEAADKLRFFVVKFRNQSENKSFLQENPQIKLPPDYLIYESFKMNYRSYYDGGRKTAQWILQIIGKYKDLSNIRILDWGCGPGRVVRHLPELAPNAEIFGTDYNSNSISWNLSSIPGVEFNQNGIEAKLPYPDGFFDVIYGISIFTHLSEQKHYEWRNELHRVLKHEGIILLTMQGNAFRTILTLDEKRKFDKGEIVVRGNVTEGHRTFSAFQPDEFMLKFLRDFKILEHISSSERSGKLEQDVWVVSKGN